MNGRLNANLASYNLNLTYEQKQLLCLARLLLRKTKILIIEEGLTSLDYKTEIFVEKVIREQFKDCTIITIAHCPQAVADCDKIIVCFYYLL